MKRVLFLIFFCIQISSCEKNINFDLKNAPDVLVVDATIENDEFPQVILTKSFDFFSNINPELLTNSFVHNAVVSISNGSLTHQMKEYEYPALGGYKVYAVEQVVNSRPLQQMDFKKDDKIAVIFGNEVTGVEQDTILQCDACIEIPQLGMKHSLNIATAAGVVLWELVRNRIPCP